MDIDHDVRVHAERQYGLITRHQLRALGASTEAIRHRVRRGGWIRLSPQVLRLHGAPVTERQAAMAAVLDAGPGAFLSHQSAVAWWELPGFDLRPVHVSRPRTGTRRTRRLGIIHYPGRVSVNHIAVLDDMPLSTPTRAVFELAGILHPKRVERLLDTAWARQLVDWHSLHAGLVILGRRGRPGIALLRELLRERGPDYRPAESGLERRFEQILADDGQEPMERQVDVGGDDGWIGRVDHLDRQARLIVEVNSERYHEALVDARSDATRHEALSAAGFRVEIVWDVEIWHAPRDVARRIRRARAEGRRRAAP